MATESKKKNRKLRVKSKSGAVRAYLKGQPDAGPTEVASALKKRGISISPAHVSNVKAAMRKADESGKTSLGMKTLANAANGRAKRRKKKHAPDDAVSLSSLLQARQFAKNVGGLEEASQLIDVLSELQH
jgi:hypothetical protein